MNGQTKACTKCKKVLDISHFRKAKNKPLNVRSDCKECNKEYRQTNKNKLLVSQYKRIASDVTLLPKRKAWNALYYAKRTGKINKPEICSICSKLVGREKLQAHHADYLKPLEVLWCCQDCHIELDAVKRKAA